MSGEFRAHRECDVVQVYRQLSAQDRWVGVAYGAMGGVVATASRGTRTMTRTALQQALQRGATGFVATVAEPGRREFAPRMAIDGLRGPAAVPTTGERAPRRR